MKLENYFFLEIHYYFTDDSHSMDAFVKNRCDRALLNIFEEASKKLGLKKYLQVEVLPVSAGGLREYFRFAVPSDKMINLLALLVAVLPHVVTLEPPLVQDTTSILSKENEKLRYENTEIKLKLLENKLNDIEAKQRAKEDHSGLDTFTVLKIISEDPTHQIVLSKEAGLDKKNKKLKREKTKLKKNIIQKKLAYLENKDLSVEEIEYETEDVNNIAYHLLMENERLRKNLSILYENMSDYKKIDSIGLTTYDKNHKVVSKEKRLARNNFDS